MRQQIGSEALVKCRVEGAVTRMHIRGNTTHLLLLMVQPGADIIDSIGW